MVVTISSSHPNSVTIASSLHARLRQLAPLLHQSGPGILFQFLAEVVGGSSNPLGRLEVYCQLGPDLDRFCREMPPVLRVVK
jgi:hypothetical protein